MIIPRILIAGVHSGSGKTTLAVGIVAALKRRGLKVQTFKVGPDFLDPTWLTTASERPCYNLDGWMSGRGYVERLFCRAVQDADIAVIEGVMGLFDGAQEIDGSGSSAEIAQWLQAPVILAVNVHGMAQSIAPVAAGFAGFKQGVQVRGIIANHCGSENHRAILNEALMSAGQAPLVGAVPRMGFPELRSRHLGLVTAEPAQNCSPKVIESFGIGAEKCLNIDEILKIARHAPEFHSVTPSPSPKNLPSNKPFRLAVARDEAFHFYYPDLFDELEQRNARIIGFSPLRDSSLPPDVDAVYLGGGYPEEFADILSANEGMLGSLRRFAQSGRPVYAECGGLIYLSQAITTKDSKPYPLLGILPAETRMLNRCKRLGYVEVELVEDTLWGKAGDWLRGHEFHYGELVSNPAGQQGWTPVYRKRSKKGLQEDEGFYQRRHRILASFVHLHLPSRPAALDRFVRMCQNDSSFCLPH